MKFLITLLLILPLNIEAKQLRIAIIDSGINEILVKSKLCDNKKTSLIGDNSLIDTIGHGTMVAQKISNELGNLDYCLISIQAFSKNKLASAELIARGVSLSIAEKADIINLSLSGIDYSFVESLAIVKALDKGIKVVAAAGNHGLNFEEKCPIFPACYDKRIIVVGNNCTYHSNKGQYVDVVHCVPGYGATSAATAVETGKLAKRLILNAK